MSSNFSIFKIGVGPSSSHTLGPMLAGNLFCTKIINRLSEIQRIVITFYGSLSLTSRGHLSDKAVIWGLNGLQAKDLDAEIQDTSIHKVLQEHTITLCGQKDIAFDYQRDAVFSKEFLPLHENGMTLQALDSNGGVLDEETYYSIGGGFVQIPCIERNAFGAIKAISAARMAMTRKSTPKVGLDEVIKTMHETGKDMNYKYKETALGGLAKNLSVC